MTTPTMETTAEYIDLTHIESEDGSSYHRGNRRSGDDEDDHDNVNVTFPPLQQLQRRLIEVASAENILESIMEDENFDGVNYHPQEKLSRINNLKIALRSPVGSLAVLLMIFSTLALLLKSSGAGFILYIFSCLGLVLAPTIIIQKMKLQWEPTFREVSNNLRMKVNDFSMLNSLLKNESERLERQVKRLSAVEGRFNQIVGREHIDVARARSLVRKNGQIQKEMKKLQAATEMQAIMEAIMLADKDSNYHISDKELNELTLRLRVIAAGGRLSSQSPSSISQDKIKAAFKKAMTNQGASLGGIHSHLQAQQQGGALI